MKHFKCVIEGKDYEWNDGRCAFWFVIDGDAYVSGYDEKEDIRRSHRVPRFWVVV